MLCAPSTIKLVGSELRATDCKEEKILWKQEMWMLCHK